MEVESALLAKSSLQNRAKVQFRLAPQTLIVNTEHNLFRLAACLVAVAPSTCTGQSRAFQVEMVPPVIFPFLLSSKRVILALAQIAILYFLQMELGACAMPHAVLVFKFRFEIPQDHSANYALTSEQERVKSLRVRTIRACLPV